MPVAVTVSRQQAATLLGVSVETVDRWVMAGRLERLPGLRYVRLTIPSVARVCGVGPDMIFAALAAQSASGKSPARETKGGAR